MLKTEKHTLVIKKKSLRTKTKNSNISAYPLTNPPSPLFSTPFRNINFHHYLKLFKKAKNI